MLTRIGKRSIRVFSVAVGVGVGVLHNGGLSEARADHFFFHHHHGQVVTSTQQVSTVNTGNLTAPQVAFFAPQVAYGQVTTPALTAPQVSFYTPQVFYAATSSAPNLTAPQVTGNRFFAPQVATYMPSATSTPAATTYTPQVAPSANPNVLTMNPDAISFPSLASLFSGDSMGLHNFKQQLAGAIIGQKGSLAAGSPGRAAAVKAIEDTALKLLSALPGAGPILGNTDVQNDIENFVNNLIVKLAGGKASTSTAPPTGTSTTPVTTTTAPTSSRLDIVIHIDNPTPVAAGSTTTTTTTPPPPAPGSVTPAANPNKVDVYIHIDTATPGK